MEENKQEIYKPDCSKMEYRYLGNTGLKVSVLGFGNWVNNMNDEMTKECFKKCLENGINYFDTAEVYGLGAGETAFGKIIKELNIPREKIVVSTKIFRIGDDPNDSFLSRKHIREGLKNSLKRLQLDYVDIVFCHRYDMHTPLEETCRAMTWLIDHGYAFYWGTSEWTASQIMEAYGICDRLGLKRPIVEQCHYNMLYRNPMEVDYRDLFKKYKMGTTIWSPLESGILTGKYINETPNDSRAKLTNDNANFAFINYMKNKAEYDEKLNKLKEIAEKKCGCNLTTLAIAWCIANPDVSVCLLGASKPAQLDDTIKALEVYRTIDKDPWIEIEKILDNTPKGEVDYRIWKELPSRRNVAMGIDYIKEEK